LSDQHKWRDLDLRLPSVADRQQAAAEAKKQAVERHRAMLNNPGFAERQAARQVVITAREKRVGERKAAAEARRAREAADQAAQEAAERAARETALQAEVAGRQAAAEAKAAREREIQEALLNTRKARKAARKAKKRRG
jgi:hypothetical protein